MPVAEHVSRDTVRGGRFALAGDGTLVYSRETADERPLLWVDRQGRTEHITAPPHTFIDPRVSPDGSRIAVQAADGDNDVWICDTRAGLAPPGQLRSRRGRDPGLVARRGLAGLGDAALGPAAPAAAPPRGRQR